jgi:hypothetical protein
MCAPVYSNIEINDRKSFLRLNFPSIPRCQRIGFIVYFKYNKLLLKQLKQIANCKTKIQK